MTKKILSIFLSIVMVFAIAPVSVFAEDNILNYLTYKINNGEVTITDCDTSISGDVTIPDTIEGYPVTSIAYAAFYGCTSLTSVTIPDSVTNIGFAAFKNCTSLTSVTIPDFVASIDSMAFRDCTSLTSVTIPDSVTNIGDAAFEYCTSLTSVTIPDSVTSIGDSAFYGCTSLKNITIPHSVTTIGELAFFGCTSLTSITVDAKNENYSSDNGILFNKDKTELVCYPAGKTETSYVIPNSVTSIGDWVFAGCTSLTSITIPDSVTSIGLGAFDDCTSLASITIPHFVTSMHYDVFDGCTSLETIYGHDGSAARSASYTGHWADDFVSVCDYAETVTAPTCIEKGYTTYTCSICDYSYVNNYVSASDKYHAYAVVETVEPTCIDKGHTTYTCLHCSDTYEVDEATTAHVCTDSLYCDVCNAFVLDYEIIDGEVTITDCDGKINGDITIPDTIEGYPFTRIGDNAFYDCTSLTSITIPDSVTRIGDNAFYDCTSLISVTIPDSVTRIGNFAFENCTSLTSITIPDSVTSIGSAAFENCTSLTSITIPDSVTSIGNDVFVNCTSLTNITIPDLVTSIGILVFYNTGYYNDESNWENGVLYIGKHLINAKKDITECEIKEGTLTIDGAFIGCTSLTSVTIPDSVTSIGYAAFESCTSLTSVKIPNSVTTIESSAFVGCTSLKNITIPNSVTTIESDTFAYCTSLTSVTIPDSVTSIDHWTFLGCTSLTSITIPDSVTSIAYAAFEDCTSLETIYGYAGSVAETYANEKGITFVAIEETVSELIVNDNADITVKDTVAASVPEMSVDDIIKSVKNENVQILGKDGKAIASDAFVGTGSKIQVLDKDGKVLSEYEVMVKSDVDGNGKITPADARLALRASAKLDKLEGVFETAANYDDKDKVSTSDARMILRKAAGLE